MPYSGAVCSATRDALLEIVPLHEAGNTYMYTIIYFELGKYVCIFLHSFILWQVEMAARPTPDLLTYYTG